jgi:hypothetical protein
MPPPKTASRVRHFNVTTLGGGIFADRNALDIPDQGCAENENFVFTNGNLIPRPGYAEVATTGSALDVVHLDSFNFVGGIPAFNILMRVTNNAGLIDILSLSGSTWTSRGSYAAQYEADYPPSSGCFKGKWYLTPGGAGSELLVWGGTGGGGVVKVRDNQPVTELKAPLGARCMAISASRIFLANVLDGGTRVGYRIAWCSQAEPDKWGSGVGAGTAGYVDLADDLDDITCLYAGQDFVIAFKRNSIYYGRFIGGLRQFDFKRITDRVGCIALASLRTGPGGVLLFAGDDSVYAMPPGEAPVSIADTVRERIYQLSSKTNLHRARGLYDRRFRLYHLVVPNLTGQICRIFTVNLTNNSWWEGELTNAFGPVGTGSVSSTHFWRTGNWGQQLLLGCSNGKIYEYSFDYDSDGGTAFDCQWLSKLIHIPTVFQQQTQQATLQKLRVLGTQGVCSLNTYTGDGQDRLVKTEWGTQTLDGVQTPLLRERTLSAEMFHAEITAVSTDQPVITGAYYGLNPLGDTRGY